MAVEPVLAEALLLGDLEGVLVVALHVGHDIADGREAQVQQFLKLQVLHLDDVLCVLLERSRTDLLSSKHADEH